MSVHKAWMFYRIQNIRVRALSDWRWFWTTYWEHGAWEANPIKQAWFAVTHVPTHRATAAKKGVFLCMSRKLKIHLNSDLFCVPWCTLALHIWKSTISVFERQILIRTPFFILKYVHFYPNTVSFTYSNLFTLISQTCIRHFFSLSFSPVNTTCQRIHAVIFEAVNKADYWSKYYFRFSTYKSHM